MSPIIISLMSGASLLSGSIAEEGSTASTAVDSDAAIIITGERVLRTTAETPSSVAVFTQDEIEDSSASRVDELLAWVPNVAMGSGSQGPTIRGQDTTGALQALPAFLGGNRPRTTLVIDGRRQTYNEFVFGDAPTWDIGRVEVFRSPQTTTQGQNSIAGAIFLHSNDPVFDSQRRLRLTGGNRRLGQASAVVSGPLSSDMAFRISGDLRYSRPASRIADVMDGADPNHRAYGQVRAKLLAQPDAMSGMRVTLTYVHLEAQSPQIDGVKAPFGQRRDDRPAYGIFRTNADSLTLNARQEFGSASTVTLTASVGDSSARRLAIRNFGEASNKSRDWSVEGQFNWSIPGLAEGVAGVSRNVVRLHQTIDLSASTGLGRFRDVQGGLGLFGQARLEILPHWFLEAGLRYQEDRQQRTGIFDAKTSLIALDYDHRFRAWLPKLSLTRELSRDTRLGVLIQRAYNPGGTTLRLDTGSADDFDAETLWNYELFGRSRLLDGKLTLSANIFRNEIKDAQRAKSITILAPNGLGVGFADLFNLPKARTYGAEAEMRWAPVRGLSIHAGAGLLRTRIRRSGTEIAEYQGKEFERSPRLTGTLGIAWQPQDELSFSAALRHNSGYFSDDSNNPLLRIADYQVADIRAEWRRERWSAFAFARNVFDTFHLTYLSAPTSGSVADPRQVGIGVEAIF